MGDVIFVPPAGGEVVGDSPERRVEIVSEHDTLHATWSRFGPRRDGAELHVHHGHVDVFYVLDGELRVGLGDEDAGVTLAAGSLVCVPPGVVHGFRNESDAEVRFLNLHAPGRGFAAFLRGLRDGRDVPYDQHPPPAQGGRTPDDAIVTRRESPTDRLGAPARVLADVDEIAIAETVSEPGGPAAAPHVHRRHVQSLYVVEGSLTIAAGSRELRADAGAWVQVPPGIPHAVALTDQGAARFLEIHTPSCGFGRFVRGAEAGAGAFDQVPA